MNRDQKDRRKFAAAALQGSIAGRVIPYFSGEDAEYETWIDKVASLAHDVSKELMIEMLCTEEDEDDPRNFLSPMGLHGGLKDIHDKLMAEVENTTTGIVGDPEASEKARLEAVKMLMSRTLADDGLTARDLTPEEVQRRVEDLRNARTQVSVGKTSISLDGDGFSGA